MIALVAPVLLLAAHPVRMDLPDGDTGRICLMEYVGG